MLHSPRRLIVMRRWERYKRNFASLTPDVILGRLRPPFCSTGLRRPSPIATGETHAIFAISERLRIVRRVEIASERTGPGASVTTEIAVFNRLGLALATDSAVTITGGGRVKVFNTADQLFKLSPRRPVAIMFNGNMDCLGVPWEILVKDFRAGQGNRDRPTVDLWAKDFWNMLKSTARKRANCWRLYENVATREIEAIPIVLVARSEAMFSADQSKSLTLINSTFEKYC